MRPARSNCAIWYWPHRLRKGVWGIAVKMSGPWIAIKHANKRPLCPKPPLQVMEHDWTYDRINLSTLPNIHAEQTFFHKPPRPAAPRCMYVLLDVLWLSMLYQVGVNWEVTGWIFFFFSFTHSFNMGRPDLLTSILCVFKDHPSVLEAGLVVEDWKIKLSLFPVAEVALCTSEW